MRADCIVWGGSDSMRSRLNRLAFLVVAMLLACGRVKRPGSADASGDAGSAAQTGAGGSAEAAGDPCDAPNAFPIWGKPYDAERDCIDTETHIDDVACTLRPEPGDPDFYYSDGFSCLKRLADNQVVWVFAFNRLGFDPNVWENCTPREHIAPKGCYAAGCTDAPRSSCSLELTKQHYDCSATGEYDENCCGQTCATDEDCATGQECVGVTGAGQWWCWDNPGNICDCGGPFGGRKMRCLPR